MNSSHVFSTVIWYSPNVCRKQDIFCHCLCGALWRALQYQYNKLTEIIAVLITVKFKKLRLMFGFSEFQWTQLITTRCHGESSQVMLSRPLLSNVKESNRRKILSTYNKDCGHQMPSPAPSPLECQAGTRSRRVYSDLTVMPQAFGDTLSLCGWIFKQFLKWLSLGMKDFAICSPERFLILLSSLCSH